MAAAAWRKLKAKIFSRKMAAIIIGLAMAKYNAAWRESGMKIWWRNIGNGGEKQAKIINISNESEMAKAKYQRRKSAKIINSNQ
jgi:hypothetical protein